jgi:hypothetical protein
MKPIKFKESNTIYAKNQKEYLPLPVYKEYNTEEGQVISCWHLTLVERIKLLFTGKLYLCQLTFHNKLQPQLPSVHKWTLLNKDYFKKQKQDDLIPDPYDH